MQGDSGGSWLLIREDNWARTKGEDKGTGRTLTVGHIGLERIQANRVFNLNKDNRICYNLGMTVYGPTSGSCGRLLLLAKSLCV